MPVALMEVLELLIKAVLIPSIAILAKYAVNALDSWTASKVVEMENATVAEYLTEITEIISQAVLCTTQTYVDSLKAQGKFDEEAQKIAFAKTKQTVLALLTQEAKDFLTKMYGDIDLWLDTKIEQMTLLSKNQ